jgi:hypothetical protein
MTEDYPPDAPVADNHRLRVGMCVGAAITILAVVGCVVIARWIW